MWSWPGCPGAKQVLPGSPAVHLTVHAHRGTVQDLTAAAATIVTATPVWSVQRSCYTAKLPRQITMKQISNRASGAPLFTPYFRTASSQGRQMRGARPVCHLRWPRQLDWFRQQPTVLQLHPHLCHFGATMTCMVSLSSQPMKAFLELMMKHAPEMGVAPWCHIKTELTVIKTEQLVFRFVNA